MTSSEAAKSVKCPKCGTVYQIRADIIGKIKCKKCPAAFEVGVSATERKYSEKREQSDHKLAVKLMIVGGIVLAVLAIIITVASKKSPGSGVPFETRRKPSLPHFDDTPAVRRGEIPKSPHPADISKQFLRALASDDKATAEKIFLFDRYFKAFDEKRGAAPEERYANMSPEAQAERRAEAMDALFHPELCQTVKQHLLPLVESGEKSVVVDATTESDVGTFQWRSPDERGKDLLLINVVVALKAGLDPKADGGRADAWGVFRCDTQWLQSTLTVAKPQKRPIDALMERKVLEERAAARARGGAPPEDDPRQLPPAEGTGPTQLANIETSVRALMNPAASASEVNGAREQILAMGKLSIPMLLNQLVGKDHKKDETAIRDSNAVCLLLEEITGVSEFKYKPALGGGFGVATSDEAGAERERAVRQWFGWWKKNKLTFVKRAEVKDEEEPGK